MIIRRLGLLTAVVAVAATLPLQPAHADVQAGTEVTLTVADRVNADLQYGIYSSASDTALVPESDDHSVSEMTTSTDGSRIVSVEDTYPASGDSHERVVVRDVSGRLVRVLDDIVVGSFQTSSDFVFDSSPSISPDGSTVLWTRLSITGPSGHAMFNSSLQRAAMAGGAATTVPGSADLSFGAFLDDSTLIATTQAGAVVSLPAAGGSSRPVSGPQNASEFRAFGNHLVWVQDTTGSSTTAPATSDVVGATFTIDNGAVTLSPSHVFATGLNNTSPSWSHDGSLIRFIKMNDVDTPGDVWSVSSDPSLSAPATGTATPGDEFAVASGFTDAVAPGAAVANPFTLNGTSVGLSWTLPADADLSGVIISRSPGAAPIYVAAPATSYTVANLPLNSTFTYTFTAVDRSGNLAASSTSASRSVTALRPNPSFTDPTSARTATAPFSVTFGTGLPSTTTFTVDYSANGGAFTSWIPGLTGAKRPFGLASSGAASTTSVPGNSYRFRITVTDAYGNSGSTLTTGAAVVPYDQTRATFSKGAYTYRSVDRWLGSVAVLPSTGISARVILTGNRLQIIGDRCPTCGVVDIYVGTAKVGSVDTYSKTRVVRAVLFTQTYATTAARAITIRSRGTAHRPSVILDGYAMRR
jgi:hypothetical protein